MEIFSADLRADSEKRTYLQLHKHISIFTLSLKVPSPNLSESLGKAECFQKCSIFLFLASLLISSTTTHSDSRDINPCCMQLKCYQNIGHYCVLAWTKVGSFRAECFRDLSTVQAHYSFLCKYSTDRVRDFFVLWK